MRRWIGLVVCILFLLGVGALGARATYPSIPTWYAGLQKPSWNPPNWLFGPVWTILYLMMAVSLWRIGCRVTWHGASRALIFFAIQLALNASWSWIFFAAKRPDWAFMDIVLLWAAIVLTIKRFFSLDRPAALLLIPYLSWVSFAAALNLAIWRLNP